jgi:hypothetical protein
VLGLDRNNYLAHLWVRMTGRLPETDSDGILSRPTSILGWILSILFWAFVVTVGVFLVVGFVRGAIGLLG